MAPSADKSTGQALLVLSNCRTIPGVSGKYIGGDRESDITLNDKYNQWRHIFGQVRLTGHSIVGCNTVVEWHNCAFLGAYVTYDIAPDGTPGYEGWLGGDGTYQFYIIDTIIQPTDQPPTFGWVGLPPPP